MAGEPNPGRGTRIRGARQLAALAALAGLTLAGPAAAQKVDLVAATTSASLPAPLAMDFETGWVQHDEAVELMVSTKKATDAWYIFVQSDDPDLGGYGKPVDDLLWRVQGSSTWNSVAASEQLVSSGEGSGSVFVELAVALRWGDDVPATYMGDLAFRIDAKNRPK